MRIATPKPSTASASTPTIAPAGRGSTNSRGGAFEPNRPSSRRCHQRVMASPARKATAATATPVQREVAGEGDDADVDGDELSAGDHGTLPPQPLGVGVEGDRGARTAPSTAAGAGSAPPVQRRRTRRARRRATAADPPAAAVTIAAVRPSPISFERGPGKSYGAVSPAGRSAGDEPGQVGGQRRRPLRRHGLGAVRQDDARSSRRDGTRCRSDRRSSQSSPV